MNIVVQNHFRQLSVRNQKYSAVWLKSAECNSGVTKYTVNYTCYSNICYTVVVIGLISVVGEFV